jgi:hypothetical protein
LKPEPHLPPHAVLCFHLCCFELSLQVRLGVQTAQPAAAAGSAAAAARARVRQHVALVPAAGVVV